MTESSTLQLAREQSIEDAIERAARCLRAGETQEAERFYRAILQRRSIPARDDDGSRVTAGARQSKAESLRKSPDERTIDKTFEEPSRLEIETLIALFNLGHYVEGERFARELTQRFPEFGYGWNVLGAMLRSLGRCAEALRAYRKAVALIPENAELQNNMGAAHWDVGQFPEAEACHRRALALNPNYAEAHFNLANALKEQGRRIEEAASLCSALSLKPNYAEAYDNLGVLLMEQGESSAAETCHRRALAINQNLVQPHCNLGVALKEQGRLDEAEASYRNALQLDPQHVGAYSNLLFTINCNAKHSSERCLNQVRGYDELTTGRVARPFTQWGGANQSKRLRVGFVSGDLRNHPAGYFMEALLAHLDPASIETVAYSTHPACDELTVRLQKSVSEWKPLLGRSDAAAAKAIHDDSIHILFDLSGHTGNNRLPVFAWKPAPIQVSWLGYFATTGLTAMDYIVGDPYVTPLTEDDHFVEKIWRLPESYLCFTAPDLMLDPGPLPARAANAVTFGCFNNLSKMNDAVVALWSRVLHAVPGSRLLLKTKQLMDPVVCATTRERFAAQGIASNRLLLEGSSPRSELLAAYRRVDIALDPFPYPGGTTSVEALWMGVPIITRCGDRFLSHLGESIAQNAGLSDWIATDDDDYVGKAVLHSADFTRLASLRGGLRAQVLASPLFDAPRFARFFESALWGMWRRWQSQQGNST